MTREETWWHAIGMLPDNIIEEALAYVPESRRSPRWKKILLIAAAAVLLVLIGCVAAGWFFAPGYGIIPAYTDMGVNVYATEERVQIGSYTLEGIVFTENEADSSENSLTNDRLTRDRLMLWLYCADQDTLQQWPDIWVNGNPYTFLHYRMTPNSNLACYTYIRKTTPDYDYENKQPIPLETIPVTGEGTIVTIQPVQGEQSLPDGAPVEVSLVPAESGLIEQIRLTDAKYISFLPLTENVVMANLHDPDALTCRNGAWDMAARGEFTLHYEDGTESALAGFLSMDNANPGRVTGIVSDRYDQPVSSITVDSLSVILDYTMRQADDVPAFTYTFPLMEVGETLSCNERMWDGIGVELWLTSISRTEERMQYTTELRNLTGDPLITDGGGTCLFYAGEGIVRDGYSTDEHALFQRHCTETDGELYTGRTATPKGMEYALQLETGDPVILVLQDVTYTYANPDGTPLGEVELNGNS